MNEIKALTGLRGIAALWVFFLHATWGWKGDSWAIKLASFGGLGVVVFFVLSGFILSYVYTERLKENSVGYREFLGARFARVYPLHIVTLLLFAIMAMASPKKALLQPNDDWYTFVLNLFLLQSWGFTELLSWNQPSWSISTEAFAYLLFPLFAARLSKVKPLILLAIIAFVSVQIIFSPYGRLIDWAKSVGFLTPGGKQFAYGISLISFFWLFVCGCVLFNLVKRSRGFLKHFLFYDCFTLVGLSLITYCLVNATTEADLVMWQVVLAFSFIIVGLSNDSGFFKMLFGNKLVHFSGKISYALYLSAIMCGTILKSNIVLSKLNIPKVSIWWELVFSIMVATILHYAVELPARRAINKLVQHKDMTSSWRKLYNPNGIASIPSQES